MMSNNTRKLVLVLMLLTVINSVAIGTTYMDVEDVSEKIEQLNEKNKEIQSYLLQGAEFSSNENSSTVRVRKGSLLVYQGREGDVVPYTFQPLPTRTVYIDVGDVSYDASFQESLAESQVVVEQSSYEPSGKGFALNIDEPDDWGYASGESAGLPIALQIAATDDSVELKEGVVATGRINTEGRVLSVNAVEQKAVSAEKSGYDTVIAPYTKNNIDVEGIDVVHVNDFEQAAEYGLVSSS